MSLSQLAEDLETDKVMALALAMDHYQVTRCQISQEGFNIVERTMQLVHGRQGADNIQRVELLVNDQYATRTPGAPALRHLAGTTAIRLNIKAKPEHWTNEADRPLSLLIPDGYWEDQKSPPVPIEYDAGSYSQRDVISKALEFDKYGLQLWGTASMTRQKRISEWIHALRVGYVVKYVPWWKPAPPED